MTGQAVPGEIARSSEPELEYEAELVRLAKEHSREAWSDIYERNHPKLFRYVLARVGQRETAEDLTATVFLEAFRGIGSYTSRGRPLLAWLYRIARNVVSYHHRSLFRQRAGRDALHAPARALSGLLGPRSGRGPGRGESPHANETGELADPASAIERWDLRQAITQLSHDQREVIILRYFVGLTSPEVAGVLGKRERAVYSLQARAIKALRRHLR